MKLKSSETHARDGRIFAIEVWSRRPGAAAGIRHTSTPAASSLTMEAKDHPEVEAFASAPKPAATAGGQPFPWLVSIQFHGVAVHGYAPCRPSPQFAARTL